jgi:hypothetical protein
MLIEEVDRSVRFSSNLILYREDRERIETTVFGDRITIVRALSREAKAWALSR